VRSLAGDLIETVLSEVGSSFSATPHTADEIETYAGALADMLCAYLERLMEVPVLDPAPRRSTALAPR
jgi:hypothetical protein